MYRLSTDVGGTFTDGVRLEENSGEIIVSKVSTTPGNPAIGTINAVEDLSVSMNEVGFFVHGTTVVINALIENNGAKTALITTEGFRDVLEIGRSNRKNMYDALYKKPSSLVPRRLRFEVPERITSSGDIERRIDVSAVAEMIKKMKQEGIEAVAVCLLNAYVNPVHEVELGDFLRKNYPEAAVSLSHEITRHYYEFERTSTTVQNAYVMPVVQNYLRSLEKDLLERNYQDVTQIMQSNGGVMTSGVARDMPISMVESGPAAGMIGAAALGKMLGYEDIIAYDMGGTTAKTAIITGGLPETADVYEVDDRPILLPVVDLREIGAGGGSIAWVDEAEALHVGPKSSGADPGPACYMRGGTDPCVTDANLQLGLLSEDYFLGGAMEISPQLAHDAIKNIADRFNLTIDETALGIRRIVNANMSSLLQSISLKRGYDPRDFVMVAFGGAGPLHATAVADDLKMGKVIVPMNSGVFSAWGMLMADLRHDFAMTFIQPMATATPDTLNAEFRNLREKVQQIFAQESIDEGDIKINHEMDIRYLGQEHALTIQVNETLKEDDLKEAARRFDEQHMAVYGHNGPEEPKEIVSLKVIGIGTVKKPAIKPLEKGETTPPSSADKGKRKVYLGEGEYADFSVYKRDELLAGNNIEGPAVVEEITSTTVINKNQTCEVDQYGNLIITINQGE